MARSAIEGFQKTTASLVPEFDFDVIGQAGVDAWTGTTAGLTLEVIDYSQFQNEMGYSGAHPLLNLGKDKVLKCTLSTASTAAIFLANDHPVTEFAISSGTTGLYMFVNEANWGETYSAGGPGVKLWCLDGGIGDYRAWDAPTVNVNTSGEWNLVGGIDDDNYDVQAAGSPTLVDRIRINIDTNAGDPVFYITSVFYGAKRRSTLMIEQDDINLDTVNYFADLDAAGLKGVVNGVAGNVDLPGRPTTAQMKAFLDNGHFVYTHGADGLRTDLGGDSALFIAQWESELALWRAFYPSVLTDDALLHGALPLSQTDQTTREWMRSVGYKTMRMTGATPKQGLISQPEFANTQYMHLPGWAPDAELFATIKTAIDKAVGSGTDLCLYLHQYITSSGNRAVIQQAFAYIALLEIQGSIEVMPRHLWYGKSIAQYGVRSEI